MSRYLVTLKPLEPYFFGNERTLQFPGKIESTIVKSEYYIESEEVPSQTTIFGLLRFLILKKADKLSSSDNSFSLKQEQAQLVGKRGFQIGNEKKGDYGKLKSLGSLFIVEERNGQCLKYIPCPFDHQKAHKEYNPFRMKSFNESIFPDGYIAKDGLADAYLCLDDRLSVVDKTEIFKDHEQVGIQTKSVEKAFFKRKYKRLEEKYCFGCYVEADIDCLPSNEVITMGQQRTPFLFRITEADEKVDDDIQKIMSSVDVSKNYSVYYALSPVLFRESPKGVIYRINKNKLFQCLQEKDSGMGHIRSGLREIVQAGSVFYVKMGMEKEFEQSYRNDNFENIGLNHMIVLRGE